MQKKFAISCMSGGYKNVFSQGVLRAFEDNNLFANAYVSCSSSTLICAYAALKRMNNLDVSFWLKGFNISQIPGNSQSEAMLSSIDLLKAPILNELWQDFIPRLLVTTSYVNNEKATAEVQSDRAKRLGQKLLIDALKKDSKWRDENLNLRLYDSYKDDRTFLMTKDNFCDVAYATTRMLHAWHIPAFINNEAYLDGSYTSLCPVNEVAELGYEKIICILTECNNRNYDFFLNREILPKINNTEILFIAPDCDLKKLGVDFYKIEDNSLEKVYNHGYEKALEFLNINL